MGVTFGDALSYQKEQSDRKQVLGVQKCTTNYGVLLELGRVPLILEARKLSLKNWDRIRKKKGNVLVTKSYENACRKKLDWDQTARDLL